jgi:hypothetical protein
MGKFVRDGRCVVDHKTFKSGLDLSDEKPLSQMPLMTKP